jgi:NhaP-type Na+/H+ or K+/H+ antiporter
MHHSAALTIALALASGVLVQALAFHLRLPGIVLLLATGFLLGPEFANVIRPATLDTDLMTLVGFAVAVILFEGGMNLKLSRLRREQVIIRRLVTWGGLITAGGGAAAALLFLKWDTRTSLLFGTLVMVTGPTVVTPLLRRIRVIPSLQTVLEAEGIIIDAIGAIVAVVTLEIVLHPTTHALAMSIAGLPLRMGTGLAVGILGGAFISVLLRMDHIIPERLGNVFALAMAVATFQISNALISESGLVAVIVAGLVVGNVRTRILRELIEFKEQLTALFIGMLFILLSANLRLADLRQLGWGGMAVVLSLMLVVRPITVLICSYGTGISWREKVFLAWLAPRGIVAAAIAALFAQTMDAAGMPGGASLRAMVFLVIVTTVIIQGLPAGLIARVLRVRQEKGPTGLIVGANALGRAIATLLGGTVGKTVMIIDNDPELCRAASEAGLHPVEGNAVEEEYLRSAGVDGAKVLVAVTGNEGINLVSARKAMVDFRVRRSYVAVDRKRSGVSADGVIEAGARVLFGAPCDLHAWIHRCDKNLVTIERWRRQKRKKGATNLDIRRGYEPVATMPFLPLIVQRAWRRFVVDDRWNPKPHDELWLAIVTERMTEARAWLTDNGWQPIGQG